MEPNHPSIAILGIGTAVPKHRLDQVDTARRLAEALSDNPDSARWARRIFKQCGVETRYTCEPNLLEEAADCRYFKQSAMDDIPTTAERMNIYKKESVPLALHAARQAFEDSGVSASSITHIITVSCTGQFLPGLDVAMVRHLELDAAVTRIPLTFIGCAAGLKAIGLARQITASNPSAKALVVCVELCTLHIQPSSERESLFATSFFGDGASACIVGTADSEHNGIYQLGQEHSVLLPNCADEMVWEVGNYGFDLYLSPSIPRLIGEWIPAEVERLYGEAKLDLWAIHPGGRGIVDVLKERFALTEEQTKPSLDVLRQVGNVSSATILFVLNEMRKQLKERGAKSSSGIALAFGPGLTAELLQIMYVPATITEEQSIGEACV